MSTKNIATVEDSAGDECKVLGSDYGTLVLDSDDSEMEYTYEGALALRNAINTFLGDESKSVPGAGAALASEIPLNEALLRIAAVHDKTVGFRYAKGDGATIEWRRLKPEKVYVAKSGALSFVGYDPDRDDVRAYRVDRIKGDVGIA